MSYNLKRKLQPYHFDTLQSYQCIWDAMKQFVDSRHPQKDADQLWFLEHYPVYTQGQAGKPEHLKRTNPNIPLIKSNRGGQITYHGPGQLMIYTLFHLPSLSLSIHEFVYRLEQWIIHLLTQYQIPSQRKDGAPGIYHINGEKIASIGLRVSKGTTYHGICLNVCADLTPFDDINPCGNPEQKMRNIITDCPSITLSQVKVDLTDLLRHHFPYDIHRQDTLSSCLQ